MSGAQDPWWRHENRVDDADDEARNQSRLPRRRSKPLTPMGFPQRPESEDLTSCPFCIRARD